MARRPDGKGSKEGMSSEPPYVLTKGKVLSPVVGFQNGIPGNPPEPKMRGDAKPIGSWRAPDGARNPSNNALSAFGLDRKRQGEKG